MSSEVAVAAFENIFGPAMGRAKAWTKGEHLVLAKAWIHATELGSATVGADQSSDTFWAKVKHELQVRAPPGPEAYGRYHHRGHNAISGHFRDKVAHDVCKFNKALRMVYSCNPTGVIQCQMVNMAVAIHLGKTSRMEYQFKDFDAAEWINYRVWLVLRKHPKFMPPKRPALAANEPPPAQEDLLAGVEGDDADDMLLSSTEDDDDTVQNLADRFEGGVPPAEDMMYNQGVTGTRHNNYVPALPLLPRNAAAVIIGVTNTNLRTNNCAPAPAGASGSRPDVLSLPSSSAKKRGGSKGRTAAKAQLAADEHQRKKIKTLMDLTLVQKQRQVSNERFQKFQMLKWQHEIESDPVKKASLTSAMGNLLTDSGCFPEESTTMHQPDEDTDHVADSDSE